MSEPSVRGPGNVAGVSASGLLLSCFALLISSFVSNYHLLFSYLVKLIVFLGPLFVTKFLVLLALVTLLPGLGYVLGLCSTVLDKFRSNAEEGTQRQLDAFEGSEVYRIIFEAPDLESGRHGLGIEEPPVDKFPIYGDQGVRKTDGNHPDEGIAQPDTEVGKKSGTLFQEKPCCRTESLEGMEDEVKFEAGGEDFNKVVDEEKQDFHNSKSDSPWMKGSKATTIDSNNGDNVIDERRQGGFESTRREKEWNRTLAYKLMEERQDVEGEGMDSLWETYNEEDESNKDFRNKAKEEEEEEEKEEEEEEGMMEERMCCLQASRLSAGMIERRPPSPNLNLVRISKAFRGIGWFAFA